MFISILFMRLGNLVAKALVSGKRVIILVVRAVLIMGLYVYVIPMLSGHAVRVVAHVDTFPSVFQL
jgi:hypothetical protein